MKETSNWLKIAEQKAQTELTFLRRQVRGLNAFYSINPFPELIEERRIVNAKIREVRKYLREERFKAVLRGDLSAEKYRPSPPKQPEQSNVISLENQANESEQRQLLMVS